VPRAAAPRADRARGAARPDGEGDHRRARGAGGRRGEAAAPAGRPRRQDAVGRGRRGPPRPARDGRRRGGRGQGARRQVVEREPRAGAQGPGHGDRAPRERAEAPAAAETAAAAATTTAAAAAGSAATTAAAATAARRAGGARPGRAAAEEAAGARLGERARREGLVMRAVSLAVACVLALATMAHAQDAPSAQWSLGRGTQPYAGVPFSLELVAEGFDDSAQPDPPKVEIPGAKVSLLGVTPNTSTSIQIINGRRIDSVSVTWVLRYRVTADKPGRLAVPSVTVKQGKKQASARGGEINVESIPETTDMKIALELPSRPVYVGEQLPVKLVWMFRRQPSQDPAFNAPLLGLDALT